MKKKYMVYEHSLAFSNQKNSLATFMERCPWLELDSEVVPVAFMVYGSSSIRVGCLTQLRCFSCSLILSILNFEAIV